MNSKIAPPLIVIVSDNWQDTRLDKALGELEIIGSRARAAHLISTGQVSVDGQPAKASLKLQAGQKLKITIPEPVANELQAYEFKLDIVFEDEDLMVINKPAGLVVHPAAGHAQDTLVNALLHHNPQLSMKWQHRPGIVHRIDKDTTGLLVVAKKDQAHEHLVKQFQARSVHRRYLALCWGKLATEKGRIESWLARHPQNRKRFASIKTLKGQINRNPEPAPRLGKWAVTTYKSLAYNSHVGVSCVELKLLTGRTHQIRIHLSELGHPILADELYGGKKKLSARVGASHREILESLPHFCLHARELGFTHPVSGEELKFSAPWPDELGPVIELLFPEQNSW